MMGTIAWRISGWCLIRVEVLGIIEGWAAIWANIHEDKKIFVIRESELFYCQDAAEKALVVFLEQERERLTEQYAYDMKLINDSISNIEIYK